MLQTIWHTVHELYGLLVRCIYLVSLALLEFDRCCHLTNGENHIKDYNFSMCFMDKRRSYRFGTTWGCVNNSWVNISLKFCWLCWTTILISTKFMEINFLLSRVWKTDGLDMQGQRLNYQNPIFPHVGAPLSLCKIRSCHVFIYWN